MSVSTDNNLEQVSTVPVTRGLYILRYIKGADTAALSPMAFVRSPADPESSIRIISPPGQPADELVAPGSSLVVLAQGAGKLEIIVRTRSPGGARNAEFQLEALHPRSGGSVEVLPSSSVNGVLAPAPNHTAVVFSMLAHVARHGDVEMPNGEWIAGPSAPAPIEGLELRCGVQGLNVETQVLVAGEWSPWVSNWSFAGSRGRARPLSGLRFRLVGSAADDFVLEADALFLGSPVKTTRGSDVELVNFAGSDPLVGLRLGLRATDRRTLQTSSRTGPSGQTVSSRDQVFKPPRVRVFRAHS